MTTRKSNASGVGARNICLGQRIPMPARSTFPGKFRRIVIGLPCLRGPSPDLAHCDNPRLER